MTAFESAPFIVIWETTRACALACVLPIPVGNVRERDLVAVYRDDPLFRALRDSSRLGGRCGRYEYRERCGGSRARAYAATGDPLAEDPGCAYEPAVGR